MSSPVVAVTADHSVATAWEAMRQRQVHHLVVLDEYGLAAVLDDRTLSAQWPSGGPEAPHRRKVGRMLATPMATADLTVIALGRADASASRYVAEIQRRLAAQDAVRYRLHATGPSLEGATADILAIVGELHAVPFEQGSARVYTVLKVDERRDRDQTLDDKVRSVERLLEG